MRGFKFNAVMNYLCKTSKFLQKLTDDNKNEDKVTREKLGEHMSF